VTNQEDIYFLKSSHHAILGDSFYKVLTVTNECEENYCPVIKFRIQGPLEVLHENTNIAMAKKVQTKIAQGLDINLMFSKTLVGEYALGLFKETAHTQIEDNTVLDESIFDDYFASLIKKNIVQSSVAEARSRLRPQLQAFMVDISNELKEGQK
jgi:hypothetical protein